MADQQTEPLQITCRGFRSFRNLDVTLGPVTVLIGANGSGKSNLVSLFRLVEWMMKGDLQLFIRRSGGASTLLYQGPKETSKLSVTVQAPSPDERYERLKAEFELEWGADDQLFFAEQKFAVLGGQTGYNGFMEGHKPPEMSRECVLATQSDFGGGHPAPEMVRELLSGWRVYHFQDTSAQAGIRRSSDVTSGYTLRANGENLAAFLLHLQKNHRPYYERIVAVIRGVVPFFRDFLLLPAASKVAIRWRSQDSEYEFGAHQLSDGTLRFMAITALLLQPDESFPGLMVLDEPELGLHPYAISVLAGMVRQASAKARIVLATQSPALLDHFTAQEVLVLEQHQGCSRADSLDEHRLQAWLEEYSLSELWEKNRLGGRPSR